MGAVNTVCTRGFDFALAPFDNHPWGGLVVVSALTGLALIFLFRYTSNQSAIRTTKDLILSHLLEVLLYRDDLRVVLRAQARLALDNAKYLGLALVPLVFMLIPVGLLLAQLDLRYSHRPLHIGERAIVQVKLSPEVDLDAVSLIAPAGVEMETQALRLPTQREVDWRIRAIGNGAGLLIVRVNGDDITKEIALGLQARRVPVVRVDGGLWSQFLHPGEPPLPSAGPVKAISITYPEAKLTLFGRSLHWLWPWLIISMLFGYALKGPLRVAV